LGLEQVRKLRGVSHPPKDGNPGFGYSMAPSLPREMRQSLGNKDFRVGLALAKGFEMVVLDGIPGSRRRELSSRAVRNQADLGLFVFKVGLGVLE
jgi:hypothetical protein